jgi:MFS transporter, OFA family, oxalate/formate antiporter
MIISKLAMIAQDQADLGAWASCWWPCWRSATAPARMAGHAVGPIGRKPTLFLCFAMQAVLIILAPSPRRERSWPGPVVLALLSALIGANYGANLALFPS